MIGLIGSYEHTIDSNGRLSIPVRFREYLITHSDGTIVMTTVPVNSCVVVYPLPAWNTITERFRQVEALGASGIIKDFLRMFYSRAVECLLDKQGRILLPSQLREYAGLIDKETVLVGHVNIFEIWDRSKWQQKEAQTLEDPERLQEAMASLGI